MTDTFDDLVATLEIEEIAYVGPPHRIVVTCGGCQRSKLSPAGEYAVVLDDHWRPRSILYDCPRCGARLAPADPATARAHIAAGARLVDAATAAAHMHPSRGDQP